ncbi:MAG TPA: hypothetical protein VH479_11755 [Acidimicrobiales bacterium]
MASVLGVAALFAAGCAQENDGAPHLSPPDTALSAAEVASEEARADSMLLTLDDFPDGWTAVPAAPEDRVRIDPADLARCVGAGDAPAIIDLPHAATPTFVSPGGDAVIAQVFLAPDDTDPRRMIDLLRDEAAPGCYAEGYQAAVDDLPAGEGFAADVELGTVTGVRLPYTPFGNTTVAWRISIPLTVEHENVNLYIDSVVTRVDRAIVSVTFQTQLRPYDRDGSERVTQILVQRVTDAMSSAA